MHVQEKNLEALDTKQTFSSRAAAHLYSSARYKVCRFHTCAQPLF